MSLPPPTWLRAFDAAARKGSFSAAAEDLGLTPAAVSQQVRLLEQHLDATLFERLPRGVALTDLGQAYALRLRLGFAEIETATQALFARHPPSLVRLRASISCAAFVLAPALPGFLASHPQIRVELSTFVWANRFEDSGSDLDVAFGFGDWEGVEAHHLGHEHAVLVTPPGTAPDPDRILAGPRIVITGSEVDWPNLIAQEGWPQPGNLPPILADSSLIALNCVLSGQGAAIVLERFAAPYLDRGLLSAPFAARLPVRPSHFLVERPHAASRPEVRAVAAWIRGLYASG